MWQKGKKIFRKATASLPLVHIPGEAQVDSAMQFYENEKLHVGKYLNVSMSKLLLFQDLPESRKFSRDLTTDEQRYQYQVYEWVIPLRNMKTPPNV